MVPKPGPHDPPPGGWKPAPSWDPGLPPLLPPPEPEPKEAAT
jgi:hypothetical protein